MLNRRVFKKLVQRTSQCVKRTSGARDQTISLRQLLGPMFLKLPSSNTVFVSIAFRNTSGRMFSKQDGANCF